MQTNLLFPILDCCLVALNGTLPLLVLFGFFEARKNNTYRFRTRRFFITIFSLIILNALAVFPTVSILRKNLVEGSQNSEKCALANRATHEFIMSNLGLMFPEVVNASTTQCWRSALSNYAEDQWNGSFRENVVAKELSESANKIDRQEDYYEVVRSQTNPLHLLAKDYTVMEMVLNSIWKTAAGVYKAERELFHEPDKTGWTPPVNEKIVKNYRQYLANCSSLKPLPWAELGENILSSPVQVCIGRCL